MQTRTLQAVTAAHSQRLSALHQRRDLALREAALGRDSELRDLPDARALYQRFDRAVAAALEARIVTEHKAAAARETAIERARDTRGAALTSAHLKRRTADLAALDRKTQSEAATEKKFRETLTSLSPTAPLEARQKTTREAERLRQQQLNEAAETYANAMTAAQGAYRKDTDDALLDERDAERAAEHTHAAARRAALASEAAAVAAAERELFNGLQEIAAAREALDRYRAVISRIHSETATAEQALFRQFRDDLQTVG